MREVCGLVVEEYADEKAIRPRLQLVVQRDDIMLDVDRIRNLVNDWVFNILDFADDTRVM